MAQVVYVVFGFGVALIAVGTLALILPEIKDVVVLLFFVSTPGELFVLAKSWRDISWRSVAFVAAGLIAGVPVGAWILTWSEPTFLLMLLGGVLAGAGLLFLAAGAKASLRFPPWMAPLVGLSAGVLGGLFGTAGPPLILYYQLSGLEKSAFRRSLMTLFLLVTLVRFPAYAVSGLLTAPRLWSGIAILPAALLGVLIGQRIHIHLSEAAFRRLVSVGLIVIGTVLLTTTS